MELGRFRPVRLSGAEWSRARRLRRPRRAYLARTPIRGAIYGEATDLREIPHRDALGYARNRYSAHAPSTPMLYLLGGPEYERPMRPAIAPIRKGAAFGCAQIQAAPLDIAAEAAVPCGRYGSDSRPSVCGARE